MRDSLPNYVCDKIHQDIRDGHWSRIVVRGQYRRDAKERISSVEKRGKRFNWHRPTSKILDDNTLEIHCFPGKDYVKHNALLIAVYLQIMKEKNVNAVLSEPVVEYMVPSAEDCTDLFMKSNLPFMGEVDMVVFGYVENVSQHSSDEWETGTSQPDQLFAWQKETLSDGRIISYLGCMISIWGDIAGSLIKVLKQVNKVRHIIHLGKAGSLRRQTSELEPRPIRPNQVLVTGSSSCMDLKVIKWDSTFENVAMQRNKQKVMVLDGENVTVFSPLIENGLWFDRWDGRADWVDCEAFHAATACREESITFGYLHIISDTLARYDPENLSSERGSLALHHREQAFEEMRNIFLDSLLEHWS